ncbi:sugar ABC transporter permease [Acuticoccus sp. M5D2P5]|uniref:carbohydrate ABC transporter permease n=1 Tax=Acuticoccus kalidii TaxID=2910977 RepID=UPI001F15F8FC|nr:sugar ABC transporter permease [Acuticoccus kalidii]MCF3934858.1 sugar ABC transporter permease [Acuticoccus kalidii]
MQTRRDAAILWLFLILPVGYMVAFVGYPVVYNLVMSVQDVTLGNLATWDRPFVGLGNYVELIANERFRLVVRNSVIFVTVNVVLQIAFGLAIALYFENRFPGARYMRGLFLAAWMLPPLVIGALWKWMYAADYGLINYVLESIGLSDGPIYWLSNPDIVLAAVIAANIWFGTPFIMLLLSAGIANIPRELYEAASLDGAGAIQRFRFVTLPMLKATLLAVACLATVYTMRAFDLIWALSQGGPIDASNVLPLYSYQLSFEQFRFGGGSAVATFSFVVVFIVALLYVRTIRHEKAM